MPIIELLLVVSFGSLLATVVVNSIQTNQQNKQLQETFYRLIESQDGQISLIQLAAGAKIDAGVAKQFLENQVQNFNATLEVTQDGESYYQFPKLEFNKEK